MVSQGLKIGGRCPPYMIAVMSHQSSVISHLFRVRRIPTGRAPDEKEEIMRKERVLKFWAAGGLAGGVLAATVWAQSPVPPTGPPDPGAVCMPAEGGRIHRAARHIGRVLQDNLIGYPQEFV